MALHTYHLYGHNVTALVRRYGIALGHSLVQTNGDFVKAAGVDMILLTYPDINFLPGSLKALESVGWKMRQVSINTTVLCFEAKAVYRGAYMRSPNLKECV